jgi:hypothetical protein
MMGGTQGSATALRRRRLTLAPRQAAVSHQASLLHGSDGSRFRSLVSDGSASRSDEEGTPFRVAQ